MSADNMIAVVEMIKDIYVVKEVTWPELENISYQEIWDSFSPAMKFNKAMKMSFKLFKKIQPEYGIRIFDFDSFTSQLKVV